MNPQYLPPSQAPSGAFSGKQLPNGAGLLPPGAGVAFRPPQGMVPPMPQHMTQQMPQQISNSHLPPMQTAMPPLMGNPQMQASAAPSMPPPMANPQMKSAPMPPPMGNAQMQTSASSPMVNVQLQSSPASSMPPPMQTSAASMPPQMGNAQMHTSAAPSMPPHMGHPQMQTSVPSMPPPMGNPQMQTSMAPSMPPSMPPSMQTSIPGMPPPMGNPQMQTSVAPSMPPSMQTSVPAMPPHMGNPQMQTSTPSMPPPMGNSQMQTSAPSMPPPMGNPQMQTSAPSMPPPMGNPQMQASMPPPMGNSQVQTSAASPMVNVQLQGSPASSMPPPMQTSTPSMPPPMGNPQMHSSAASMVNSQMKPSAASSMPPPMQTSTSSMSAPMGNPQMQPTPSMPPPMANAQPPPQMQPPMVNPLQMQPPPPQSSSNRLGGAMPPMQPKIPGPNMSRPSMPSMQSMPGMPSMPPMPSQRVPPPGPNQLTNQMSGMNLGPSKPGYSPTDVSQLNGNSVRPPQYPGAMPPPLPQQHQQPTAAPPPPLAPGGYPGYPPMPQQQQQQQPPMQPGYYQQQTQGFPPQQGYVQHQPPQPGYGVQAPGGYPQQPQLQKRLDPDEMPSPIQVISDDQRTRSGAFATNQRGLGPPLVSTDFVTQDQGNVGPRFVRSTMYCVPTTADIVKQTAVPFALIISPMACVEAEEYPPPIVDTSLQPTGPVRCVRCKAYMCPFMQFIDAGRRFQCNFCKATTEVPAEYFQHLDHTGQRVDKYDRPELCLGAYEFLATADYCRDNKLPKAPAVVFIIDVSYNSVKSGLVQLLCDEMGNILDSLPVDQGQDRSLMKVGFITFSSSVHFYNCKSSLAQPQMMVVGDTQEMFMPLLDGFLCDAEESAGVIDALMGQIPAMFAETRETETVLLPAIQAGLEALKASECAGKLVVFHSTLPVAEAPGRLKNRDDRKLLGTDKEKTVLTPQTQAYNQLGQECVAAGCSVDLFVANTAYVDVATIGQVARLTGGEVFKYTYFQASVDGERLVRDVIRDISRPIGFDATMRVRTSTGVRPTDFYGHFYMSNTTDIELASIDCDKAIALEIKHDDKLGEEDGVLVQAALLYTSCSGQRRLRILNLSLRTSSQMIEVYRSCELDALINFFGKESVFRLMEHAPKAVKDALINRCARILACYRKNCATPSSSGQLILPECMKLLPLYTNCLLKSDALSGGADMTPDDRSHVMMAVATMDVPSSAVYFYPRLLPVHDLAPEEKAEGVAVRCPMQIRCTQEKMLDHGAYILENGIHMFLWIGPEVSSDWLRQVFGVQTAAEVDSNLTALPALDNPLSDALCRLVEQIRDQRRTCMRLTVVKPREKMEFVFRHFLVEDRGQDGSPSYVDFLCHMHREIRLLLS